jgi:hypothetical protein
MVGALSRSRDNAFFFPRRWGTLVILMNRLLKNYDFQLANQHR